MKIMRYVTVCAVLLFFVLTYSFSQENAAENTLDNITENVSKNNLKNSEEKANKLLFKINGVITNASEIIETRFRKGASVFLPIKAHQRYAAVVLSKNLDTALRLDINSQRVFKDLFLGENAGILFTPIEQDVSTAPITSSIEQEKTPINKSINDQNDAEATAIITALTVDVQNADKNQKAETTRGEYTLSVYTVESPPIVTVETVLKTQNLSPEDTIVGRITKEYAIELEENKRIYIYMSSTNFDTLLEFSDRYGNTVVSDDWAQTDTQNFTSSLVTVVVPKTDTYFINATSFDGNTTGDFDLEMKIFDNTLQLHQNDKITTESTKIFEKYVKEYPLILKPQEMRTVEIVALSGDIEVLFTDAQRGSLYTQEVVEGQTVVFPVRALEEGEYKIIISSEALTPASYSIKLYQ